MDDFDNKPINLIFVAAGDRRIRGRLVLAQCDVPQGSQMMAGIASWEPPEPCKLPQAGWTAQANLESEDEVEVGSGVRDPLAVWLLCFANEPLKSFSRGPYRDVVSEESTVPAVLTSRTISDHRPRVII